MATWICRNGRSASVSLLLCGALLVQLDAVVEHTGAIVVDGSRKGPSAAKNQSHESEMIDSYNTKTCGISDPDMEQSDFVNSAREGQFPWLVSLQRNFGYSGKMMHFCMGSFISKTWILSAAHCFADPAFEIERHLKDETVIVRAGSRNVYGAKNANFTIKRIFFHKRFDLASPIGFDVALIELNEPAPIRTSYDGKLPFINTVCLPIEGKKYAEGQAVRVAGWGDTEFKNPKSKPDNLLTTDMLLTNASRCADIFQKSGGTKKAKTQFHKFKDFICAYYKGTRDACQGDSGGSLLEYADDKAVVVGIVSYGLGCATEHVPGVYERVSSLMPWIKDISQNRHNATVEFKVLEAHKKKS